MNKEFVLKMIKAKKLELEAIQELLPDKLKTDIDEVSEVLKGIAKECMMEIYFSGKAEFTREDKEKNNDSEDRKGKPDFCVTKMHGRKEQQQAKKIIIE